MPALQQSAVSDMPVNSSGIVNGISDQSADMLELLKHKNIQMGTRLEIKKKFGADGSIEIKIRSQQPVTISEHVAKNLLVAYDNRNK
jgi:DtxR family Mn-dependent transcriptional regulator